MIIRILTTRYIQYKLIIKLECHASDPERIFNCKLKETQIKLKIATLEWINYLF